MQTIPIADVPAQILTVTLGGQACRMRIFTRRDMLLLDLYISDQLIVAGALCLTNVKIVRDAYLGLKGDLVFTDTQGAENPVSPGLGSRFLLIYLEPADLVD